MTRFPIRDPAVAKAYDAFLPQQREGLLSLRNLIFETAEQTEGVGRLEETLKWGQPAYLTPETKSGSTIRLGRPKQGGIAIYAHCQTSIIADFQSLFPDEMTYEGNRAVHFTPEDELPMEALTMLIRSALTYKLRR